MRAQALAFSTGLITIRTGGSVSVTFINDDAGEDHNFEIQAPGAPLRDTCIGPCRDAYTFAAPPPGSYSFYCITHPDMGGELRVTP